MCIRDRSYTLNTCDDNFTYTGGNVVFNKANPTGSFILTSAASNGCDSIVNVQINFSDFNISNALLYNCDGSDPKITLNLASHPGPYTINIDGQQIATNQNLPFTTSITSGNHTLFISTPAGCEESILVSVEDTKGPDVMLTQSPNPDGTIRINVIAPQNVIYDLRWSPASSLSCNNCFDPVSYTHLDVYKRQAHPCANIANMTVVVNMITSPSFTQIEPVCQGSSFTLPLTSTNGITGIWSPAINNTNTTLYTFCLLYTSRCV